MSAKRAGSGLLGVVRRSSEVERLRRLARAALVAAAYGCSDANLPKEDPCRGATTCSTCAARAACGWCSGAGRCVTGTSGGPRDAITSCGSWAWTRAACPAVDAGFMDVAPADAGFMDVAPADAGFVDVAPADAGSVDVAPPDPCATARASAASTVGCNGGVFGAQRRADQIGGACTPDGRSPPGIATCAPAPGGARGVCAPTDDAGVGTCVYACPTSSTYVSTGGCPTGSRCFAVEGSSVCFRDCRASADCFAGELCDEEGSCVPAPPDGGACRRNRTACTTASQCCGGRCVDGVCCRALAGSGCTAGNDDCCGAGSLCLISVCARPSMM